jgi:hypothetical protein
MLLDWVVGWIFGFFKFVLLVAILIAAAAFLVSLFSRSDDD